MPEVTRDFHFAATGIGSVPFVDIEPTCQSILRATPLIPFWPQFVKRSYCEDMNIQYTEGLPLLEIQETSRGLAISPAMDKENELVRFYDHFLADDLDYFAISRDYSAGLHALGEMIGAGAAGDAPFIKGQTVGPITFAASVTDLGGKAVLYNPELLEAMTKGLSIKALWQIRELERSGKEPIIFLDEPYLSGFGSAFSPVQRHQVIDSIREVVGYLRERTDALIGIHCCGNTDWSMVIEAGVDIINFDAFEYLHNFLLYRDDIVRFLGGEGIIAWGIVPTANFTGNESVGELLALLEEGFTRLHQWGIDPDLLARRSILTPACGMGTMASDAACGCLNLLSEISRECRNRH